MKNNIEQKIKESLQNHEMPYNASAWSTMQAKLDVVKPVSVAAPVSPLKWIIVAASVAVVGVVSYLAINANSEPTQKEQIQAKTIEVDELNSTSSNNTTNDSKVIESELPSTPSKNNTSNSNSNNSPANIQSNPTDRITNKGNENTINNNNGYSTNPSNSKINESNNNLSAGNNNTNGNPLNPSKNYILPKVNDACEGDVITVQNTNDVSILVEGPDLHFIIPANSERKVRTKKSGSHKITLMTDDNTSKSSTFFIKNSPNADFVIDTDTKFEKGLPTTKLETTSIGVDYTWVIGKTRINGEKVNAHFYTPGNHNVTLLVKDANGCTSSTTKAVQIDEKYNLMAVNSFIPEDLDNRNNTFMPFALTQRDVKFNLIILDPTDGRVVFQSKDASNAWDGIDRTTGNPVNYGTTYIWKVTIENAEPNENNEYAGNITPIRKR